MFGQLCLSVVLSAFIIAMVGCSGGGGGNSTNNPPPEDEFSIEITPKVLSYQDANEQIPRLLWLSAVGKGDPGVSQIYVNVQVNHDFIEVDSAVQEGNEVVLNIEINKRAWGGVYKGDLILGVCADSACKKHLANSPYTIPYDIRINESAVRYEPVLAIPGQIVDFSEAHLVINVGAGTQAGPIRYRMELADELGEIIFPAEMQTDFGISEITADGFTLNPPALSDGSYLYRYELGLSGLPGTDLPFNVYYFVGREGGASNQIIFMQDPVEIDVLYGQKDSKGSVDYLAVGADRNILDGIQFDISYNDGADWMWAHEERQNGKIALNLITENLPLGTYTAQLSATKLHHQIHGDTEVIVNVKDGIVLYHQLPTLQATDVRTDVNEHHIAVSNTRGSTGTWHTETSTPWIILDTAAGPFSSVEDTYRASFHIDLHALSDLPNGQISEGVIRVIADDDSFPPADVKIQLEKRFPQIKAMSVTEVVVGQPFDVIATGISFSSAFSTPVGLRTNDNTFLEEQSFVVDQPSLTDTYMKLSHPGIPSPGTYEVVFDHGPNRDNSYLIPFVPRPTIVVVSQQ